MPEKNSNKIWITLIVLLSVVCIIQAVIILNDLSRKSPESRIVKDFDRFSSFLNDKYKKEKNDSHELFDRFFDDDFFSRNSDSFKEIEKFHKRMEDIMDDDILSRFNDSWSGWIDKRFTGEDKDLNFNMEEKKDEYVFEIDIPELKDKQININIDKNGIAIKGEFSQSVEKKDSDGNVISRYETRRTLSKIIPIPEGADYSNAKTENKEDRIIVRLPKIHS